MDNTVGKVFIHSKEKTSNISVRTQRVLEGSSGIESLTATWTMFSEVACFLLVNVTS